MTPLAEYLALIQFEVQKSFDFSEQLMRDLSDSETAQLQLAIDTVELELPVTFEDRLIEVKDQPENDESEALPRGPNIITKLDAPFLGASTLSGLRAAKVANDPIAKVAAAPAKRTRVSAKKAAASEREPAQLPAARQILVRTAKPEDTKSDASGLKFGTIRLQLKPVLK